MLRWARPNRALFSTFFHFFVGIGPELALFDPLFAPYACRCDNASAGVFRPFPSALLHASRGRGLPKWQGKTGEGERGMRPAFAKPACRQAGIYPPVAGYAGTTAGKIAD